MYCLSASISCIHHFLEHSAALYAEKIALIHEAKRITYAQINASANSLAHWFINQGISTGQRVAIIQENSLEYVVSYYGILKSGAIATALSTDLKPDGLQPILQNLEPRVIICSSRFERLLKATDLSGLPLETIIVHQPKLNWPSDIGFNIVGWEEIVSTSESANPNLHIDDAERATIVYTSGSTGIPKGVMLTHKNVVSNTDAICHYLHLRETDIQMVVLPFFYVMGKSLLNTHFAVGGTVVINNKFAYPASVVQQMADTRVTGFSGVPSTYAYLLHRSPLKNYREKLPALRYCSQAGGHMATSIKENLRMALPRHTHIYIMYGATEASARLTYLPPERFEDKMGSIGKAIPGTVMRVVDEDGSDVSPGQIGELVASGPNIMQGYWKDEASTQAVLDENGYHTGDMGYEDDEGFLFVTGRNDSLLKVGGHRINPQEIEESIISSGVVVEASVVGVPDPMLGNKLAALIVPKDDAVDVKMILNMCSDKLPRFKLPTDVFFVRTLPKNSSGKVDVKKCMDIAASKCEN